MMRKEILSITRVCMQHISHVRPSTTVLPQCTRQLAPRRLFHNTGMRAYKDDSNLRSVSTVQMSWYRVGTAALLAGIITLSFVAVLPQAITAIEGEALDPAPKEWPRPWRKQYRVYMYSETHGSRPQELLAGAEALLKEILAAEGYDATDLDILTMPTPRFDGKSQEWISAVANLVTKCGDNWMALEGEEGRGGDKALEYYARALDIHTGLDRHTSAACKGMAEIYLARDDLTRAKMFASIAVATACVAQDPHTVIPGLSEGLAQNDGEIPIEELAIAAEAVAPSLCIVRPEAHQRITTAYVNAAIDLGVIYSRLNDDQTALRVFLSVARLYSVIRNISGGEIEALERFGGFHPQYADEARAKYYVSETLWALGHGEEAVQWARSAYDEAMLNYLVDNESVEVARTALKNIAIMCGRLGRTQEAEDARKQIVKVQPNPSLKPYRWFLGYQL
ncbi:uncharacterized protein V1518DRAFT_412579 [Limtongia smithiae]|uniref:uncharacterized protein n=1 Tax=Limtongia smithiae TaxID=1125753 RepID=UPI0034CD7483